MSKSANKTLIGAFVLGGTILLLLALAVFGSGKFFKKSYTFVLFFDRSISGLSVGSPVVFRGIPVGRVTKIDLEGDLKTYEFRTAVFVELNGDSPDEEVDVNLEFTKLNEARAFGRLIAHGLRASLSTQSFITGQLMIELNIVRNADIPNVDLSFYNGVPEIPVIPSQFDSIITTLADIPIDEIANSIHKLVGQLNTIASDFNDHNVIAHADTLLLNINQVMLSAANSMKSIETLTSKANLALEGSTTEFSATFESLRKTLAEATTSFKVFNSTAKEVEVFLNSSQKIVNPNSPTIVEFNRVLREFTETARAVRVLANTLERNPEALLRGKK